MKTVIYYFTGTGNSLFLASRIAARMKDTTLEPIAKICSCQDGVPAAGEDAGAIGFIFPVHFEKVPQFVLGAVERFQFEPGQYIFAVITSGGQPGNTLYELDAILRSRGVRLAYGRNVDMPDNSIILQTPREKADARMAGVDAAVDEISLAVTDRMQMDKGFPRQHASSVTGSVSRLGVKYLYKAQERKVDASRCNLCGTCCNICPAGNISKDNGKIVIGDDCAWCFACLNWCPQKAIVFGRIDPWKRKQYRCPGISAADIIRQRR